MTAHRLVTHHVTELLTALGGTEKAVAASLTAAGITGDDNCAASCVIANYLRRHPDLVVEGVYVGEEEVTLDLPDGAVAYADVPAPVVAFIRSFDVGLYPHLMTTRAPRTPAAQMASLTARVLAHYAEELHDADPVQLAHLAERAESLPRSPVGDRMRDMTDAELALRAHTGGAL